MSKEFTCPDCGYTWQQGQHGGHSCAQIMAVTIAERDREIGRLKERGDVNAERANRLAEQLAALKAQPSGVLLPERRPEVAGTWGDMGDAYNAGVNDTIDEVARLNSSPVSADLTASECACGDQYPANSYGAGFMAANNGVCENCDAANSCGRGAVDERAAFEAAFEHMFFSSCFEREDDGTYAGRGLQGAWLGWQALAALSATAPDHSEQVRRLVPDPLREAITPHVVEWVRCGLAANNRLVDGDHPALKKIRAAIAAAPSPASQKEQG